MSKGIEKQANTKLSSHLTRLKRQSAPYPQLNISPSARSNAKPEPTLLVGEKHPKVGDVFLFRMFF